MQNIKAFMFSVSEMLAGCTDLAKAIDEISLESFQLHAAVRVFEGFLSQILDTYTLLHIDTSS